MADMTMGRQLREKRIARLRTVAAITFLLAYILFKYFNGAMADDPELSPPILQVKNQAIQLGSAITDKVIPDKEIGFLLPANLDQTVETYDFTFPRTTDNRGFPNPGAWPDTADIVLLGDSMSIGEGVGVSNGFPFLIDQSLEHRSLVNLAVMGAGIERQFRILRRFGPELAPGFVVSFLYLASTLESDKHFDAWLEDPRGMQYNDFRLSYARQREKEEKPSWLRRLEEQPLYDWVLAVVDPRLPGDSRILHEREMPDDSTLFFDRSNVKFAQRDFSAGDPDIQRSFESLSRLQALVERQNARLMLVLIPSKEEIFAEDVTGKPDSAMGIFTAELKRRGIPFLNLYPILKKSSLQETPYFSRDIHLNEYGNETIAKAFIAWFDQRGSLTRTIHE